MSEGRRHVPPRGRKPELESGLSTLPACLALGWLRLPPDGRPRPPRQCEVLSHLPWAPPTLSSPCICWLKGKAACWHCVTFFKK